MTYLMLPELGRQMALEPTFDPKDGTTIDQPNRVNRRHL
jgi:hypothetical protein